MKEYKDYCYLINDEKYIKFDDKNLNLNDNIAFPPIDRNTLNDKIKHLNKHYTLKEYELLLAFCPCCKRKIKFNYLVNHIATFHPLVYKKDYMKSFNNYLGYAKSILKTNIKSLKNTLITILNNISFQLGLYKNAIGDNENKYSQGIINDINKIIDEHLKNENMSDEQLKEYLKNKKIGNILKFTDPKYNNNSDGLFVKNLIKFNPKV